MNENEKQERLQIELPQNVAQGEYANFAIITHGSSDFSRIILAPEHAKRLLGALQENVMRYEKEFGTIKIPNHEPSTISPFDIPEGEA